MEKEVNSGAVLVSAVFGSGKHTLIPEPCSEARPFRRLGTTSFGINNLQNTSARRLIFFSKCS